MGFLWPNRRRQVGRAVNLCARCQIAASHYQGHQWLCQKHYRFGQMRASSARRGLPVPSHDELERMASEIMLCWDCERPMNWLGCDGADSVVSLKRYRDGSLGFACRSCSTRHTFAPGDSYRDQPKDQKYCPSCETVKPFSDYDLTRGHGIHGNAGYCKACAAITHYKGPISRYAPPQ